MIKHWYLIGALLCLTNLSGITNGELRFSSLYSRNLKQMVTMLDEDVDPCDDFFQHSCGYYEQTLSFADAMENEDEMTQVPPMLYNHEDRMHFFKERHMQFKSDVGKILSSLYGDCKKLQRRLRNKMPLVIWRHMLKQVPFLVTQQAIERNWPYLNYQWAMLEINGAQPSWVSLGAELAATGMQTGFPHIFFAEQTIYLVPSDMVPGCSNFTQIRESFRSLLNGRNEQIADILARELFMFCHELNSVLPSENKDEENVSDLLQDDLLSTYFDTFFTLLNFTQEEVLESRKVVMDVGRTRAILQVFHNTEERILYNFMLWRAYEALKLTTNDCFELTEEFEELLLAEYWQWHVFEGHFRREVAMATYIFHTTRFQQLRKSVLMGENWSAFLETKLQRKDFNIPRVIRAYANKYFAPDGLPAAYAELQLQDNAFYANLLQMRRLKLRSTFTQPHLDLEDVNHPHYFLRQFLYFSILILKEPLFHYYATQGFDLWQTSQLLYSSDGYYTALDCLERQNFRNYNESDTSIFYMLSEDEVLQIFNFNRAFIASYRDYQFWLQGEFFAFAEDFALDFFELDKHRIMFYAVAQQYCGRNNAIYSTLINRSFMNMPQFQQAFNCDAMAPMNPIVKCMINSCDDE